MACPRCRHRAAPDWLPSHRNPALWWSRCPACDGIAVWRGGQLEQPCAEELLPRAHRHTLALYFLEHATTVQRDTIHALSEARTQVVKEEGYLGEITRFLTRFLGYSHGLRRASPAANRPDRGPVSHREDQKPMSDDRVLQAAQSDEAATQRRIEELREEIERSEAHLQDITDFIRKYREYENVAQPVVAPAY